MKKLLAVLLSLCLIAGMLPMMALADGVELITTGDDNVSLIEPVEGGFGGVEPADDSYLDMACYNETTKVGYSSVVDALDEANAGDTVVLQKSATIKADEYRGWTVEVKSGVTLEIASGATLTIEAGVDFVKNGTVTGSLVVEEAEEPEEPEKPVETEEPEEGEEEDDSLIEIITPPEKPEEDEEEEPSEPVVPTVTFFDEDGSWEEIPVDEALERAEARTEGGYYYADLCLAIMVSRRGETVEVLNDATIDEDVSGYKAVTVSLEEGVTLTIAKGFSFGGIIDDKYGTVIDENEEEEPEPEPEPEPDPEPVVRLYPVTIYAPSGAEVKVFDGGVEVSPFNGNTWSLADGAYTYTISFRGHSYSGSFTVNGEALEINKDWGLWRVYVKPAAHGDVWVNDYGAARGDIVKVYVDPDSGYHLSDLTVTTVYGADVDIWHVRANVYAFRMPAARVVVDADFASTPSTYRVYVANTANGDLSVDETYAEEGEWVYITVKPDPGYRLEELTVTRPSGNELKVEHVRDNIFRFRMPGVRVTVDAEFELVTMPFVDVHKSQWFYDYVAFVYKAGLMDGVTRTTFAPDATTTRAMVVTILWRMAGEPTVNYVIPFNDVSGGAWYGEAVRWAASEGIVEGRSATEFDPNEAVTREELATMLYRYAEYKDYYTGAGANTNILSYTDAGKISEYAFEALQWACAEGIINGMSNGSLSPQGGATRAQLAAMLYRFCVEYVL